MKKTIYGQGNGYETYEVLDDMTVRTIDALQNDHYDFTFMEIGYPDEAGHHNLCTSEAYHNTVRACWQRVQKIKESLDDDYLYIVTVNHGGHDYNHGTNFSEDITIPIVFFGNTKGLCIIAQAVEHAQHRCHRHTQRQINAKCHGKISFPLLSGFGTFTR